MAMFAPIVIGQRSNYSGIGFSTVIWKPLKSKTLYRSKILILPWEILQWLNPLYKTNRKHGK